MVTILLDASLLGLGLSMDAAAVSMTNGMEETDMRPVKAAVVALFYGVFQAIMPLIGYLAGSLFTDLISRITPFLALAILTVLGVKMLIEGAGRRNEPMAPKRLQLKTLTAQAVATSIDALAVGVVLVPLTMRQVLLSVSVIGAITFALSFVSVYIGKKLGGVLSNKAELAGGVILILIGLKIFLEGIL